MLQAVTANRLNDGRVVFLTAARTWSTELADAALSDDAAPNLAVAAEDVRQQVIVDPYAIEVVAGADGPRPTRLREVIRASGPTIAYLPPSLMEAAE